MYFDPISVLVDFVLVSKKRGIWHIGQHGGLPPIERRGWRLLKIFAICEKAIRIRISYLHLWEGFLSMDLMCEKALRIGISYVATVV